MRQYGEIECGLVLDDIGELLILWGVIMIFFKLSVRNTELLKGKMICFKRIQQKNKWLEIEEARMAQNVNSC